MNLSNQSKKNSVGISGVFFLLMVVFGLFSELLVRQKLIISGDAAATANNILSNTMLYRLGITGDILMALFYLLTALALYRLLESVNQKLASVMVVFATAGCVLLMFNVIFEAIPLYLLQGGDYLTAISLVERQSFALFFIELFGHGYMIGQVFFALWVLPLGILIIRSGFIPKILGIFFIIEAVTMLMPVFVHFLIPNLMLETVMMVPGMIAEFSFMFWALSGIAICFISLIKFPRRRFHEG